MSDADTRSWLLLPKDYQLARLYLKPGQYNLEIEFLDSRGRLQEKKDLGAISLGPNQTVVLQERAFY